MLTEFQEYLTFENIYLWSNFGVVPLWILLIIAPNSRITQILINSVIIPLILSIAYVYIIYQAILLDEIFFDIFRLYLNLDNLYTVFATESFLLVFWIHFIALNLFLGSWVSRDAFKYNMPKKLTLIPLVLIYFAGPVGLMIYWMFRVFYSKRLGFHD
tara:strand:+ start:3207 stop:3680 length:474 start_codon:yes stop_codon:yes gene_type:complete